jgi:trehalose synthase
VNELRLLSERLAGREVSDVNSSAVGGGVAEILARFVSLRREVALDLCWIFPGDDLAIY